mmetsp:Transcript_13907/g.39558  ORF Transcript_13907/g.39558 Transcript_13907/m.39558 type:complete len:242 (-) Transcript_13907:338-1063(-)
MQHFQFSNYSCGPFYPTRSSSRSEGGGGTTSLPAPFDEVGGSGAGPRVAALFLLRGGTGAGPLALPSTAARRAPGGGGAGARSEARSRASGGGPAVPSRGVGLLAAGGSGLPASELLGMLSAGGLRSSDSRFSLASSTLSSFACKPNPTSFAIRLISSSTEPSSRPSRPSSSPWSKSVALASPDDRVHFPSSPCSSAPPPDPPRASDPDVAGSAPMAFSSSWPRALRIAPCMEVPISPAVL